MQTIHHHFAQLASQYRQLRTTDDEPILFVRKKLEKLTRIKAADVGCGAGRYDRKLFEHFGNRLSLICVDCNDEMLSELENYIRVHKIMNFKTKIASAGKLPIMSSSLHYVFTFNAIHHFPLYDFLKEASRVLRKKGYLFMYTRLKSQNKTSVWGKYFPKFWEKETRLYELPNIKQEVAKIKNLSIESLKFFEYRRISTLSRLIEQAVNHHYSTFCLYNKNEFEESLYRFKQKILQKFDPNNVYWTDRNVMFVLKQN